MKKRQRGVSLSGLLVGCVIVAMTAVLGMKVVPDVIEYFEAVQLINKVSRDVGSTDGTVSAVRRAFDKYANVDRIQSVKGDDLDITKEGNDVVISFAYSKRIPLFGNVSLLIDFEGSTAK